MSVAEPPSPLDTAATPTGHPKGHPIGFWFFFWGELAERSSYYGMRAILALYMTERLGVAKDDAGTFMSLFIAACYFFPLIGGWVADNFLGKYWTIVLFSVPYVVAQFLVGIENKYVVTGTLLLLSMGSGVIKPNISTLMGLTYDQQRPGQEQLRTSAFSWFYLAINVGAFSSQLGMPWLRDHYGYQAAFLFPAGLMSVALIVFALGKRFYARESIILKVVGGRADGRTEGRTLTGVPIRYETVSLEEKRADTRLKLQTLGRLGSVFLLIMFFWAIFDQSASTWIFFADTYMTDSMFGVKVRADAIQAFNGMFIVVLVPLSVAFFKFFPMKAIMKIGIGFAFTALSMVIMSFSGFIAPPAQKAVKVTFPEGSVVVPAWETPLDQVTAGESSAAQPVYGSGVTFKSSDWNYDGEKKKLSFTNGTVSLANGTKLEVKDGHLQGAADANTVDTTGVLEPLLKSGEELAAVKPDPAKVAVEVIDWTKPNERVTIWWQVFAYLILTIAEILVSITGLELAFVAAPQSMKSFVTACFLAVVFLANLLINAPITRLYPVMSPGVYFAMLAGAMTVVLLAFVPIAIQFNRSMAMAEANAKKAADEGKTEVV